MNSRNALRLAVLLAVFLHVPAPAQSRPGALPEIQKIEDEWAKVFYKLPTRQQVEPFESLLERARAIKAQYPERAEPLVMEAIILCTLAASDWGFDSLSRVQQARELLVKSIDLDPRAMDGTAFITLGNLYFRLPGWPLSYGDDRLALQYLEAAAKLYPDAIDVNYFLGDYWLKEGDYDRAIIYLDKADKAPVRSGQRLSDEKLKEELPAALESARNRAGSRGSFFSQLLPKKMGGTGEDPASSAGDE